MSRKRSYTELENKNVADLKKELLSNAAYYLYECASTKDKNIPYEDIEENGIPYINKVLQDAEKSLFEMKSKKLYGDDRYCAALSVLEVMEVAQKCGVELPPNLTFCNSMNKKISLSEVDAKNIKDAVEKIAITPIEIKIVLFAKLERVIEYEAPIFNEKQINEVLKRAGYAESEAELNVEPYLKNLFNDDSEDDHEQQDISNEPNVDCIGSSHDFLYDEHPS